MTTPAGRSLTRQHYRDQVALRAQAVRDAQRLWASYRLGNEASWRRLLALATPLAQARFAQSAALSARYYDRLVALELAATDKLAVAARSGLELPTAQVEASLTATGLVGAAVAKSKGLSDAAALANGFTRFAGGFSRLALEGGRASLVASVKASRLSNGWRRVTSGSPCNFCAGLAGQVSSPDGFQAHDHCTCTAEPSFG